MTHKTKDVVFPGTKKEKSKRILTTTTGSKSSCGSFSHLAKINKGRKKYQFLSKPYPHPSASLTLSRKQGKEGRRSFVSLTILLRISVTLSLPWLKLVLFSHYWLKIKTRRRRRRRRKGSLFLYLNLSIFHNCHQNFKLIRDSRI